MRFERMRGTDGNEATGNGERRARSEKSEKSNGSGEGGAVRVLHARTTALPPSISGLLKSV